MKILSSTLGALFCAVVLVATAALQACQDLDDIYARLDTMEVEVSNLQSALGALQSAHDQEKHIASVIPLEDGTSGGWLLKFADNTSISITGDDGTIPYLKADREGRWSVSYDNGATFVKVLDASGNPVVATGVQGLDVRVAVNAAGYYVLQCYKASAPGVVVKQIPTSCQCSGRHLLQALKQDDRLQALTFTLGDGSEFTFRMNYVSPTGIALLNCNPVPLSFGTQASVEFRVNPSNALLTLDVASGQIVLDKVGVVASPSRSSYVTKPVNYRLVRVEQVYDGNTGEMKAGQYRAVIEDAKRSTGYDEMVALVLNVTDAGGQRVQLSSSAFEVRWKSVEPARESQLPIAVINTPNSAPIVSKDTYVDGSTISLLAPDLSIAYQGDMKIKGRGNSTWTAPKRPYKMKFETKQSLCGEPEDKEWVLLANYYDKSLIRTDVVYWMASHFGQFDYVPRFHTVDLILNGEEQGNYQLGEQVKISDDRVNVGKDGFLLEIDMKAAPADVTFRVSHIGQPINIKAPDVTVGDDDYNYVVDYLRRADAALFAPDWLDESRGYKTLIDIHSFAEWYLVNEMTKNGDAAFYTSCYMNLSRQGKLRMGPLWDFDISLGGYPPSWSSTSGYINHTDGFYIKDVKWMARMFEDREFVDAVKSRYAVYYANKQAILDYIDATARANQPSARADNRLWGTVCAKKSSDADFDAAYAAQIDYLKNWLSTRMDWLKRAYDEM